MTNSGFDVISTNTIISFVWNMKMPIESNTIILFVSNMKMILFLIYIITNSSFDVYSMQLHTAISLMRMSPAKKIQSPKMIIEL